MSQNLIVLLATHLLSWKRRDDVDRSRGTGKKHINMMSVKTKTQFKCNMESKASARTLHVLQLSSGGTGSEFNRVKCLDVSFFISLCS